MKAFSLFGFLLFYSFLLYGQKKDDQNLLLDAIKQLAESQNQQQIFDSLKVALNKEYLDNSKILSNHHFEYLKHNPETRLRLNRLLMNYPNKFQLLMINEQEKGERLIIKGKLLKKTTQNTKVFFFHTDNEGLYAPEHLRGGFGANNPRLFGYVSPNENGEVEIHTIVPASYPGGSLKHIHFEILEGSRKTTWSEMILDETPIPTEAQRIWAKNNGFPIVKRVKISNNLFQINVILDE